MKHLLFVLLLVSLRTLAQPAYPPITFHRSASSQFFLPRLATTADSALRIAAAVYNSPEFKDSLAKYAFSCRNFSDCHAVATLCRNCKRDRLPIKVVFDSLHRQATVSLTLVLDSTGNSFGYTSPNSYLITSHYRMVFDDHILPFSYHYAVHLCHEYMHNVGFVHFKSARSRVAADDVAEQTGLIAYHILTRWHQAGITPF